ncbi:MAG: GNAT family N-acetyltransferase [Gemmatimonadota bacterium]|nr:GNAT family N-acetyltransferase [Gemmatimonadota bacterium]
MSQASFKPAITIRRVESREAGRLAALGARLFEETYREFTDPSDMASHLAGMYGEEIQRVELADRDVITLFVEAAGDPIGYIQVRRRSTPESVEHQADVELRWFYLDTAYHGGGVAGPMMDAAEAAGRELGGGEMWLSVWTRNPRAIAFYVKRGFEEVGKSEFDVGEDRQTDLIMVTSLANEPEP